MKLQLPPSPRRPERIASNQGEKEEASSGLVLGVMGRHPSETGGRLEPDSSAAVQGSCECQRQTERSRSVGVCDTVARHGLTHLTVSIITSSPPTPPSTAILFLPPPPPVLPSFAVLISLLLTFRRCHANFPGDGVVMETRQQGRSADVWCCSGVCTNRSPVFGLLFLPRPCFFCAPVLIQVVLHPPPTAAT